MLFSHICGGGNISIAQSSLIVGTWVNLGPVYKFTPHGMIVSWGVNPDLQVNKKLWGGGEFNHCSNNLCKINRNVRIGRNYFNILRFLHQELVWQIAETDRFCYATVC